MSGTGAPESRRGLQLSPTGMTTFLVVDAILVLTFLVLLVMNVLDGGGGTPAATGGGGTQSESATTAPETTPEATAPTLPTDNQALETFVLPSGNIWCSMTQTSATCTIKQFSFAPPTPPPGCTGTVGPVFTVTADGAGQPCVPEVPSRPDDAPVLEYGQASTIGDVTCYSSRNGATCRHNPTGQGFSVARAGYTTL